MPNMSGVKSGTNKIWAKLGANKNGAAALRPLIYLKISDGYFRAPRDGLSQNSVSIGMAGMISVDRN